MFSKSSKFWKMGFASALVLAVLICNPSLAFADSSLYLGKLLSEQSSTYIGSSVDIKSGQDPLQLNISEHTDKALRYVSTKAGSSDYTAINEEGVVISFIASDEIKPKLAEVDSFDDNAQDMHALMNQAIVKAKSASEAVDIIGEAIDAHGCNSNCSWQCWVADKYGAWLFTDFSAQHWLAIKCPDLGISADSNIMSLSHKLNLDAPKNAEERKAALTKFSLNLVPFAKEHGIDRYFSDGTFNVFSSYGKPATQKQMNELYSAIEYFAPHVSDSIKESSELNPALFFIPVDINEKFNTGQMIDYINKRSAASSVKDIIQIRDVSTTEGLDITLWEGISESKQCLFLPVYAQLLDKAPSYDKTVEQKSIYQLCDDIHKKLDSLDAKGASQPREAVEKSLASAQEALVAQQARIDHGMDSVIDPKDVQSLVPQITSTVFNTTYSYLASIDQHLAAYEKKGDFTSSLNLDDLPSMEYADTYLDKNDYIADPSIRSVRIGITEETEGSKKSSKAIVSTVLILVAASFVVYKVRTK